MYVKYMLERNFKTIRIRSIKSMKTPLLKVEFTKHLTRNWLNATLTILKISSLSRRFE